MFFGCHILLQNRSVSLASGCWYVFMSPPPKFLPNYWFLTIFWKDSDYMNLMLHPYFWVFFFSITMIVLFKIKWEYPQSVFFSFILAGSARYFVNVLICPYFFAPKVLIITDQLVFYHKGFSDYCLHLYCYFHNVSADMSSSLLQAWLGRDSSGDLNYIFSGSSHQRNSTWSRTAFTPSLAVVVKYTKARQVTH